LPTEEGHGKLIEKTFPGEKVLGIVPFGGAEGIRTPDLLRAKEALSQLSYSPVFLDSLYKQAAHVNKLFAYPHELGSRLR
jgi:hypothetical protein